MVFGMEQVNAMEAEVVMVASDEACMFDGVDAVHGLEAL